MANSSGTGASEKVEREIEQLELALEDLLITSAESETAVPDGAPEAASFEPAEETADRPSRRRPRVSDSTPRERQELDPGSCCPDCGGDLQAYLADILARINDHKINRLGELLPRNRSPLTAALS